MKLSKRSFALALVAICPQTEWAQPRVNLSAVQIAALRQMRTQRSATHGGGGVFIDPPNGMTVNSGVSATVLANALIGAGITITGTPTFQGAAAQGGTFSGAPAIVGFSSGVILSSGDVTSAASTGTATDGPSGNMGT